MYNSVKPKYIFAKTTFLKNFHVNKPAFYNVNCVPTTIFVKINLLLKQKAQIRSSVIII